MLPRNNESPLNQSELDSILDSDSDDDVMSVSEYLASSHLTTTPSLVASGGHNNLEEKKIDTETKTESQECKQQSEIEKLQIQLSTKDTFWFSTLAKFIQAQLDILFDANNHDQEKVKKALLKFTEGKITNITESYTINKDCINLQDLLSIRTASPNFDMITQRERTEKKILPSPALIKLATISILKEKCLLNNIDLNFSSEVTEAIVLSNKPIFIPKKKYVFYELDDYINHFLKPYGITCKTTDVFEHALLRYANITEFPHFCRFLESDIDDNRYSRKTIYSPGYFYIYIGISNESMQKFVRFYNNEVEEETCERVSSNSYSSPILSARLNLNNIVKLFLSETFQAALQFMLSKDILSNYQLISNKANIDLDKIIATFKTMGKPYKLTTLSNFVERSLLYAFGIKEPLHAAQFQTAYRYEAFASEIDFYLGIDHAVALNLVSSINAIFSGAAKFIQADARLANQGDINLQVISIRNDIIIKNEFLEILKKGLIYLVENDIDLYEQFQVDSKTRKFTSKQLSENLDKIAAEFVESDANLSSSLRQFSLFTLQRKPLDELKIASFAVEKTIAAYESKIPTQEEYALFKTKKKQEIKTIQQELGTRNKAI